MPTKFLSPEELGIAAILLVLILRDVLKFLREVVVPRFFGAPSERAKIAQSAINDLILKKLADTMDSQTVILQRLEFVVAAHKEEFHRFTQIFHEHVRDMEHKN